MLEGIFETAAYMQNRELSWLKFNERVLLEANRVEMPLLERLKYITIFTSNLDEFFMIRVGSLADSVLLGSKLSDNKTGLSAKEQLDIIFRVIAPLYSLVNHAFSSVTKGLSEKGVELLKIQDMTGNELKVLKNYFIYNVLPVLSPSIIDPKHPFPHIANKQLNIAVTVVKRKGATFGLIAVPFELERLVFTDSSRTRFVLLEDLILHFADLAFANYTVSERCIISVTRNADLGTAEELLDEDIDFRQHMKALLKKRQRLAPVRLEIGGQISEKLLEFLCGKLFLDSAQVFYSDAPLELSFCYSLSRLLDKETVERLVWPAHVPANPLTLTPKTNMLKLASGKDMMLSLPYESISPFLLLIKQAADDHFVLSIKITLYRIDAQSKLAESLILAAENGKDVLVLMELRARFDESNNIEWASRFEEAGCRVIYGLVGYKCHSKVCLITRKEHGDIRYITQVGTGNYNERTAKLYTDLSLITANQEIGHDVAAFFNNMLIENLDGEYTHLWVAPNSFKDNVIALIEREHKKALSGENGRIIIKCNSLTDKEIIEKLVEAGADGVKITMNIRGICCLVPNLPGVTENIDVVSIVGKFLEHTRIFCFGEGEDANIYISSADLMTRNTHRRVEVACPILDPVIKKKIIFMLEVMLNDDTNAWTLLPDGTYEKREPVDPMNPKNSQEFFTSMARETEIHNSNELRAIKGADSVHSPLHRFTSSVSSLFKK
jgi:polyphosphate kinase